MGSRGFGGLQLGVQIFWVEGLSGEEFRAESSGSEGKVYGRGTVSCRGSASGRGFWI